MWTMMWAHQVWWLVIACANVPVYLCLAHTHEGEQLVDLLALAGVINLTITILVCNELLLAFAYWSFKFIPLRRFYFHRMLISIGGVHVGCAFATFAWIVAYTIELCRQTRQLDTHLARTLLATALLLPLGLAIMIVFALRPLRERFHDLWEYTHRFVGWFTLADLVAHLCVKSAALPYARDLWFTALPYLTIICLLSVFYVWFTVRRVPVRIKANLSVATLTFPGRPTLSDGTFARISTNAMQWHSFSVALTDPPKNEFALIVANGGDWTSILIQKSVDGVAPEYLYIRGVNPPGFMHMLHAYQRAVVVCTGAGIAPALPHITGRTSNISLVWIGKEHRKTYGDDVWYAVEQNIPSSQLHLHDTGKSGRPDIRLLIAQTAKDHQSEAVFVISNDSYTKHVANLCWRMGLRCYGATRDS